jgi:putative membrane protein
MVLGPVLVIILLVVPSALIAPYMRGIGPGGGEPRPRTPRDILDERYARGEIDREEYLRRLQDIEGKSEL